MSYNPKRITRAIRQRWVHRQCNLRWQALTKAVNQVSAVVEDKKPVVFFNASTRLQSMSQNAAYSLLTAHMLRLQGIPVIQFICSAGMERCVLGTNRDDPRAAPPCSTCVRQSRAVFNGMDTRWFKQQHDPEIEAAIANLSVSDLANFTYQQVPLGFWALNSLRWVLRRHNLADDSNTQFFLQSFIRSAWNVYVQFSEVLKADTPRAVVLFNGMFFPEAAARYACLEQGVRVVTHEVGLRPFTAFFTPGEATAYPMEIDPSFRLNSEMERRLEDYLALRFSGDFTMAGIRFWPDMKDPDLDFIRKAEKFQKIVPVFTNVIFDTSQVHANTLFENMFTWLNHVKDTAINHPEILFVFRAHPDESRAGKQSRESVAEWFKQAGIENLENVVFFDSGEYISSYDLIRRAHLVLVYNSTIGLEAALLGKPVLVGGKARFTQLNTSYYPATLDEYRTLLETFLMQKHVDVPLEFRTNARRFLYYQLFITSLEFRDFVEDDGIWNGYVKLKSISPEQLIPENSTTAQVLLEGILREGSFTLPL